MLRIRYSLYKFFIKRKRHFSNSQKFVNQNWPNYNIPVISMYVTANIVYAISKAKGNDNFWAKSTSFFCGLPLSCLTLVLVKEGSNKAYGIHLAFLD